MEYVLRFFLSKTEKITLNWSPKHTESRFVFTLYDGRFYINSKCSKYQLTFALSLFLSFFLKMKPSLPCHRNLSAIKLSQYTCLHLSTGTLNGRVCEWISEIDCHGYFAAIMLIELLCLWSWQLRKQQHNFCKQLPIHSHFKCLHETSEFQLRS